MMKFPVKSLAVNINILPSSVENQQNDFARINAYIELLTPLQQETTFVFPQEKGQLTKVYLPTGEVEYLGDFDGAVLGDKDQLVAELNQMITEGLNAPSIPWLKNFADKYEDLIEIGLSENKVTYPAGTTKIIFDYKRQVPFNGNTGTFDFNTTIPLPNFELTNTPGTSAMLKIQMPYGLTEDKITTATWTPIDGTGPRAFQRTSEFGQIELKDYWTADPAVSISYRY